MGAGNPTISGETKTQVRAACQPRQPYTLQSDMENGASWSRVVLHPSWFIFLIFLLIFWLHHALVAPCGIQPPSQVSNPGLLHWEHRVLTTGPPGKGERLKHGESVKWRTGKKCREPLKQNLNILVHV